MSKEYLGYSIQEYLEEQVNIIRDKVKRIKGLIRQKRFLYYFKYRIPQGIYKRFKINATNSGQRKRKSSIYQFKGVLIKSLVLNQIIQPVKFRVQVKGRIKKDSLEWVNQSNIKPVIRQIGKKIRQGGLESNRIYQVFYKFLEYREGYRQRI